MTVQAKGQVKMGRGHHEIYLSGQTKQGNSGAPPLGEGGIIQVQLYQPHNWPADSPGWRGSYTQALWPVCSRRSAPSETASWPGVGHQLPHTCSRSHQLPANTHANLMHYETKAHACTTISTTVKLGSMPENMCNSDKKISKSWWTAL